MTTSASPICTRNWPRVDAAAATTILPTDGRRIVRALEVVELTGQPFAASAPRIGSPRWNTAIIGLDWDTAVLDERLRRRTDKMFADGLVDEVATLLDRGLRDGVTASRALGYAQVIAELDAGGDGSAARELTFIGTRRYVRRQRSWFRRDHRVTWLDGAAHLPGQTLRDAGELSTGMIGATGILSTSTGEFAKGHGTENDFVLLPDLSAAIDLTPAAVAALCDRRRGLGADGLLRVTTAGAARDAGVLRRPSRRASPHDDWFMDYRNADGSIAQMCGNGVRVFAHYLWAERPGIAAADFVVGSLAGPRPVELHTVDATRPTSASRWARSTSSGRARRSVGGRRFAGIAVDVGNPHLACVDAGLTVDELAALDVAAPVTFDTAQFPEGVNVEVLTAPVGAVRCRCGSTNAEWEKRRSCGTGTVAATVRGSCASGGVNRRPPGVAFPAERSRHHHRRQRLPARTVGPGRATANCPTNGGGPTGINQVHERTPNRATSPMIRHDVSRISQHPQRRRARPRRPRRTAPRGRPVHRARRRLRGRVPPASPRTGRTRRRLDRRHRRGRRRQPGRAGGIGRDCGLGGARRTDPAPRQARPVDLHRFGQGRTSCARSCWPPAPTPSSATASSARPS